MRLKRFSSWTASQLNQSLLMPKTDFSNNPIAGKEPEFLSRMEEAFKNQARVRESTDKRELKKPLFFMMDLLLPMEIFI